jgi:hypothetical protein
LPNFTFRDLLKKFPPAKDVNCDYCDCIGCHNNNGHYNCTKKRIEISIHGECKSKFIKRTKKLGEETFTRQFYIQFQRHENGEWIFLEAAHDLREAEVKFSEQLRNEHHQLYTNKGAKIRLIEVIEIKQLHNPS